MQDTRKLFLEEAGREPTAEELKNILGFGMKKIEALYNLDEMIINFDSLEDEVYGDDVEKTINEHHDSGKIEAIFNGEDYQYYEDGVLIEAEHENDARDPENTIEENADMVAMKEKLEQILATLTAREAEVLRMRFGLRDEMPRSLEEVGKEFKVTRERVRQIEAKALRKLRHPSRSKHIKDF